MIEQIVLEYMESALDVDCYLMRPENVGDSYVMIEKTRGSETNHIKMSTFAFQSYGKTLLEAAELNEQVKQAAYDLIASPEIISSRYNTDYNFTNTADKKPRYQTTFDIYHY